MAVPHHVLIDIGSRWSSSLVLTEAELALHRWREDAEVLRAYGWGETRRRRFEALVDRLRTRHDAWARAEGGDTEDARSERTAARRWLDRAVSILEASELDHPSLGAVLAALPPPGEGAATLLDALRAAVTACLENRTRLDVETHLERALQLELGRAQCNARLIHDRRLGDLMRLCHCLSRCLRRCLI